MSDMIHDEEPILPGGLPPEPEPPPYVEEKQPWGPWATVGFTIVIFVISSIIEGIIAAVVLITLMASDGISLDELTSLLDLTGDYAGAIVGVATILNALIGTGLIWLITRARRGWSFAEYLGFRRFSGKAIVFSLLAFAVYYVISYFVESATGTSDATLELDIYSTQIWPAAVWLGLCLFGPFFEEVWVRGFIYSGFIGSRLGIIGTAVLTSLFWAVQHVQYGIVGIGMIFLFGLVLAWMRYKSGSIWPCVIVHVLNNTVAMILMASGV